MFCLVNSSFLDNSVAVFEYQKGLMEGAQEYLQVHPSRGASSTILPHRICSTHLEKKTRKAAVRLPLNAVMPKKRHTAAAHQQFHQLLQEGAVQRRMVRSKP